MSERNTPEVTGHPAMALHAGLNFKTVTYTLPETASASAHINMFALPPGARLAYCSVSHDTIGLGANTNGLISVQDSLGNIYVQSVSSVNSITLGWNPTLAANGKLLTASSNLRVVLGGYTNTGTGSPTFTLSAAYLSMDEGG